MKKINWVLVAILLLGAELRLYMCLTRNVFTDEVFYFRVARDYSFSDFIHINHWIKDHAIIHFVVLRLSLFFTSTIGYLRIINILYYMGSAWLIYKISKLIKLEKLSLLPVFFFSIHGYFIYVSSMILPYTIVIFFTLLSIYYAVKLFVAKENIKWWDYAAFVFATVAAFYSDYSFLSMFLFYLFLIISVFVFNKPKRLPLLLSYGVIMALILPGMSQLFNNIPEIQRLNSSIVPANDLAASFKQFCSMTILHDQPLFSFVIYIVYLSLFISILSLRSSFEKKHSIAYTFLVIVGCPYYVSAIVFLLIHQYVFPIIVERAAWFFPTFSLMMISVIIFMYYNLKKRLYIYIIILFLATRISNLFITDGDIKYEVSYKSFLNDYASYSLQESDEYLFIIDDGYVLFPLRYYYLSPKHSIFNTMLDDATKKTLQEKMPIILHLKTNELSLDFPQLPKQSQYSVVLPTCNEPQLMSDYFIKEANSIYCLQYLGDKKYTFIKKK